MTSLARDARDLGRGGRPWSTMVLMVSSAGGFSAHVDCDLPRQIAACTAVVTSAMLRTWAVRLEAMELTLSVRSFQVPATRNERLTAELAFGADLAGHTRDFGGEGVQLVDHGVDGFLQLQDLALHIDRDFARQVARAMAVATSAMLRTWPVRFEAMELTLSVRSFQVPATPGPGPGRQACHRCRLRGRRA